MDKKDLRAKLDRIEKEYGVYNTEDNYQVGFHAAFDIIETQIRLANDLEDFILGDINIEQLAKKIGLVKADEVPVERSEEFRRGYIRGRWESEKIVEDWLGESKPVGSMSYKLSLDTEDFEDDIEQAKEQLRELARMISSLSVSVSIKGQLK